MSDHSGKICVQELKIATARKVSGFGGFLVCIFPPSEFPVSLRIQAECGKIRARKTPNTDAFHAVCLISLSKQLWLLFEKYIYICADFLTALICGIKLSLSLNTALNIKVVIQDFFRKCKQIRRKLHICSHLLQKS